jgi:hypothetical protein
MRGTDGGSGDRHGRPGSKHAGGHDAPEPPLVSFPSVSRRGHNSGECGCKNRKDMLPILALTEFFHTGRQPSVEGEGAGYLISSVTTLRREPERRIDFLISFRRNPLKSHDSKK